MPSLSPMPISSLDKNLVTVSARIPAALAFQIQTIAESRDTTISYLIFQALADMALDESSRYWRRRRACLLRLNCRTWKS
jgi:hypothetical protein